MFMCTSNTWYNFVSSSTFARFYAKRSIASGYPTGLFLQLVYLCCDRILDDSKYTYCRTMVSSQNMLDFIPNKNTMLVSSSNGIICCRSLVTTPCTITTTGPCHRYSARETHERPYAASVIYICNPATRDCIPLRPPREVRLGKAYAFYFDPQDASYTLVGIRHSQDNTNSCSFVIYNSNLGTWRFSKEFHCFPSRICPQKHVFVNGKCHWLTRTFQMLIFDVEEESCNLINLPHIPNTECFKDNLQLPGCLGISGDRVHYACGYVFEVKIWMLKDYNEAVDQWVRVFSIPPTMEILQKLTNSPCDYFVRYTEECACVDLMTIHLHNDLLFLLVNKWQLWIYNLTTGECTRDLTIIVADTYDFVILPYSPVITRLKCPPTKKWRPRTGIKRRKKSLSHSGQTPSVENCDA